MITIGHNLSNSTSLKAPSLKVKFLHHVALKGTFFSLQLRHKVSFFSFWKHTKKLGHLKPMEKKKEWFRDRILAFLKKKKMYEIPYFFHTKSGVVESACFECDTRNLRWYTFFERKWELTVDFDWKWLLNLAVDISGFAHVFTRVLDLQIRYHQYGLTSVTLQVGGQKDVAVLKL